MEDKIYSVGAAAEYCGMPYRTAMKWAQTGEVESEYHLGKRYFTQAQADALLARIRLLRQTDGRYKAAF